MSPKKIQLLLIGGALVLFVLLFTAPKINPSPEVKKVEAPAGSEAVSDAATLDVYLGQALKSLEPALKEKADGFAAKQKNDSLSAFWDRLKRPDLASYYAEEQAKKENKAASWFSAGNRYYYAVQFSKDKSETPALYQCAMRCFNKGLALEPGNIDGQIMLASCYVEGTTNPMEGISRLREVEKTDSNNVKLQLAFAFFSVKSRQFDKAIRRFNKALAADTNRIEIYLHLADAYEQQGETASTIKALEAFAARTPDAMERNEINKYIQQLKK